MIIKMTYNDLEKLLKFTMDENGLLCDIITNKKGRTVVQDRDGFIRGTVVKDDKGWYRITHIKTLRLNTPKSFPTLSSFISACEEFNNYKQ